jgi:hypothetical protein
MKTFQAMVWPPRSQVDLLPQILRTPDRQRFVGAGPGQATFGGDDEVVRVGVQRGRDQRFGDGRTIGGGGVDEVDAQLHRPAEHLRGLGRIAGRPPDAGASELHGAETETVDGVVTDLDGPGLGRGGGGHGRLLTGEWSWHLLNGTI